MVIKKDDSRVLEPDLILSKDGEVLERSERETVRVYGELFCSYLPQILARFGRFC